jgi:hypothetical protein
MARGKRRDSSTPEYGWSTSGVQWSTVEYSGVQAEYVKYGGVLEYRSLAFSPLDDGLLNHLTQIYHACVRNVTEVYMGLMVRAYD